jgi:hypothetical protein
LDNYQTKRRDGRLFGDDFKLATWQDSRHLGQRNDFTTWQYSRYLG